MISLERNMMHMPRCFHSTETVHVAIVHLQVLWIKTRLYNKIKTKYLVTSMISVHFAGVLRGLNKPPGTPC